MPNAAYELFKLMAFRSLGKKLFKFLEGLLRLTVTTCNYCHELWVVLDFFNDLQSLVKVRKLCPHEVHSSASLAGLHARRKFLLPFRQRLVRQRQIVARHHQFDDRRRAGAPSLQTLKVQESCGGPGHISGYADVMANVEVTGAARLYRAASVWTAGLALYLVSPLCRQ